MTSHDVCLGRVGEAAHALGVAFERALVLARLKVPQADRTVHRRARKHLHDMMMT